MRIELSDSLAITFEVIDGGDILIAQDWANDKLLIARNDVEFFIEGLRRAVRESDG